MSQSFTSELWHGISDTYAAILAHPFITGLADGSLPGESFEFYVIQDALFLRKYALALSAVASRAPDNTSTEMFARHSAGIVSAEMTLHASLLSEFNIDPESMATAQEAPTALAYTSYLLATAFSGSYAEGVGAVLPCYWIYAEVGKHLLLHGSANPRYQQWIDTYGGTDFGDEAREVIVTTDKFSDELSGTERERLRRHFTTTSRYEWMFFDMSYRRESWPL